MNDLKSMREEIDVVNMELLELINKRTLLINKIIKLKNETNIDYYDPMRQDEMLKDIITQNQGPLPNELVKEVFSYIFKTTLKYMGLDKERRLIVGSHNSEVQSIHEMLGFSSNVPIIIAGPCAVENIEYLEEIAKVLKQYNIKLIRGGVYKPRTSPYDFQGLKEEGLTILHEVSRKYKMLSVTEVVDTRDVAKVAQFTDILQIGARNMHNYELLKEVGQADCPVILKRGLSSTIEEFIFAAEYIALKGNRKIILCERGIRTFETKTRNTLDISSIPIIKQETNLPIIVDLSHSLGRKDIIEPIAKSVLAVGADGIMVEVHPKPELALSDSKQQLNIKEFTSMLSNLGIS